MSTTTSSIYCDILTDNEIWPTLKEDWNRVLSQSATNVIFLTLEFQQSWWETYGDSCGKLFLIRAKDSSGTVVGFLPFCISTIDDQKIISFAGGMEVSDYLDALIVKGQETQVWQSFFDLLEKQPELWDGIDLHNLPAESPSISIIEEISRAKGHKASALVEHKCPRVTLPNTWEEYLASLDKDDRHEIRRKRRKLEKEIDDLKVCRTEETGQLDHDLETFFNLHISSSTQKRVFLTDDMKKFFSAMSKRFFESGWLRLYFLEVHSSRVASYLSFDYNNHLLLYNSGYDPSYYNSGVGVVLLSYVIERAIIEGKEVFDFLRGNERYKYEFGGKDAEIMNLKVIRG